MNIISLLISLIILMFSAILHEVAHGFVAEKLGDPTARLMGRLTLNPKPHIDLFMTILLPLLLILSGSPIIFGGAKPVPVDPFNLRDGRKDLALVSLAGPLTNVLLAVGATLLFHLLNFLPNSLILGFLTAILLIIIKLNILLAVFNLLPIPPLDGSKVFALLLPQDLSRAYLSIGSIGTLILLFLLISPIGGFSLSSVLFNIYTAAISLLGFSP